MCRGRRRLGDDLADLLGLLLGRAHLLGQLTELLARLRELLAGLPDLLGEAVDAAARAGHLHPEHALWLAGKFAPEHDPARQAYDRPDACENGPGAARAGVPVRRRRPAALRARVRVRDGPPAALGARGARAISAARARPGALGAAGGALGISAGVP